LPQVKDALLASKLDAISWEYNHLLTSQLDSQRQYFEARLQEAAAAADRQVAAAKEAAAAAERRAAAAEADAREAERKRQQLERKLVGGVRAGHDGGGTALVDTGVHQELDSDWAGAAGVPLLECEAPTTV